MLRVKKIDERHHEHPNQIDEMPIQTPDLKMTLIVTATLIAERHNCNGDHTP
jgi:hypothetical protein